MRRYVAFAEPSGAYLGELDLTDVTVTRALNAPGRLQATADARLLPDQVRPWRCSIWLEESGMIRGGGILAAVSDDGYGIWKLDCMGISGVHNRQPYTGRDLSYLAADPLDIVRDLWAWWLNQPDALPINIGDGNTSSRVGDLEYWTRADPETFGEPTRTPAPERWIDKDTPNEDVAYDLYQTTTPVDTQYHDHGVNIGHPKDDNPSDTDKPDTKEVRYQVTGGIWWEDQDDAIAGWQLTPDEDKPFLAPDACVRVRVILRFDNGTWQDFYFTGPPGRRASVKIEHAVTWGQRPADDGKKPAKHDGAKYESVWGSDSLKDDRSTGNHLWTRLQVAWQARRPDDAKEVRYQVAGNVWWEDQDDAIARRQLTPDEDKPQLDPESCVKVRIILRYDDGSETTHRFAGPKGRRVSVKLDQTTTSGEHPNDLNRPPKFDGAKYLDNWADGHGQTLWTRMTLTWALLPDGWQYHEAKPYELNWYTTHDIGRTIDQLRADGGFDYLEHTYWHDGKIRHDLLFGIPFGGRKPHLRFTVGENLGEVPQLDVRDEEYASDVLAIGAGAGAAMCLGPVVRAADRGIRRVETLIDKTITSPDQLAGLARTHLARFDGHLRLRKFDVQNHPHAPYGAFEIGDTVFIGGGPNRWVRIVSWQLNPDETITIEVEEQ
jgi:hypothetical protein